MREQLLKELIDCSPAEKAEVFQVLVRDLFPASGSSRPVLVRAQTGTVLGYFLPSDSDGSINTDIMLDLPLLADAET